MLREKDGSGADEDSCRSRVHGYFSLEAWKHAHGAALLVLRATDAAERKCSRDLFWQVRRAVVSVEANIVEGYALGTNGLFLKHLRIALGSAAEAECLIRLAGEMTYLPIEVVRQAEGVPGTTMRLLHGLRRRPPRRFSP